MNVIAISLKSSLYVFVVCCGLIFLFQLKKKQFNFYFPLCSMYSIHYQNLTQREIKIKLV